MVNKWRSRWIYRELVLSICLCIIFKLGPKIVNGQVATLVEMSSTTQLGKGQTSRSKVIVNVKRHDHIRHIGHLGYVHHIYHLHSISTSGRLDEAYSNEEVIGCYSSRMRVFHATDYHGRQ